MLRLRQLLPLLACTAVFLGTNDATVEAGGSSESETSGCYRSRLSDYAVLFTETFALKLREETNDVFINCMSFAENGELSAAIVSGRRTGGGGAEGVLVFSCLGGTLLALESERAFNTSVNESCVECADDSPAEDACITPCAEECERCYDDPNNCPCTTGLVFNEEEVINEVRNLGSQDLGPHGDRTGVVIEDTIVNSRSTQCMECEDGYQRNKSEGNPHICYACGIQFCIKCDKVESAGGQDECTTCLPRTTLYHKEGECLYGLRAEILEVAEEQEHEVEEEEEEKELARLQLAISLPIVSVAVVVSFIFMSFLAHRRYPHIGETGRTRHRNKPSELPEDGDLTIADSVFRPQPTVRLR